MKAGWMKMDNEMELTEEMLLTIRSCYFEPGLQTAADRLFEDSSENSGSFSAALNALSHIAQASLSDEHVLEGVLHILSSRDYEEIQPQGLPIAAVCAGSRSPVVRDLPVSCLDKWGSPDRVPMLEGLRTEERWLAGYRDEVLRQLKRG